MLCDVEFRDGYICRMELIYNWDHCHIYRTPDAYLIVPYKDVIIGRVPVEEFARAAKAARDAPKVKEEMKWTEIKPSSNLDTE